MSEEIPEIVKEALDCLEQAREWLHEAELTIGDELLPQSQAAIQTVIERVSTVEKMLQGEKVSLPDEVWDGDESDMESIEGVPINPPFWKGYDTIQLNGGDELSYIWTNRPFVVTDEFEKCEKFPEGIRYIVRCWDGGCHDRSTNWGILGSMVEALHIATQKKREY